MNIQEKAISAIRVLSAEAIERSKSGHPGLPLGAAAIGYELYANHLSFDAKAPDFVNRDRFVLSAGHGTMLQYSLLHLFGFDVSMDDIKNFRQTGSKTPGHPEQHITPGVDVSTGPLGQGVANAVGLAMAETMLAARFNRDGFKVFDHYTYALCGEGCLMEGIEYEAASIAGTWNLGKLILLYDCNKITIEGDSDSAFDEDIAARHQAQGWQVLRVANGNDPWEIGKAIDEAKAEKNKPSIIIITTKIGFGSAKEGQAACHGAPLGADNVKLMKKSLEWNDAEFYVPDEVYRHCAKLTERAAASHTEWQAMMKEYAKKHPDLYAALVKELSGQIDFDFEPLYNEKIEKVAIRKASNMLLNKLGAAISGFVGGSADLGPSNLSTMEGIGWYSKDNRAGRNIHFGIREHAMSAICNGLALHGGLTPYCATFFSFSDYMKNAIRMSAIMHLPVTYVLTHDTIAVGEDGPTHQPIEHLSGLRAMPVLNVFRPCDYRETVAAYQTAIKSGAPTAIVCSKQDLPSIEGSGKSALRGGYVIKDSKNFKAIILSAGSEVSVAIKAAEMLEKEGINVRVVSMPCHSIFDSQDKEYRESVLPSAVRARVSVEAGASMPWHKYVGFDGVTVAIDHFGESGKADELFEKYGITAQNVVKAVKSVL